MDANFGSATEDGLFRQLMEGAPNALVLIDRAGAIVMFNAQAEKIFEYGRSEVLGQPIEMLVPNRLSDRHHVFRAAYVADPKPRAMGAGRDLFGLSKTGREFPVEVGLNPVETDQGSMIICSILDITERKAAEASMLEQAHRLRSLAAIVESFDDAIISTTLDGQVTSWNKAAEQIFGYTAADIVGRSILCLAIEGHADDMLAILDRIRHGKRVDHYQTQRKCKDGSLLHVSLTVSPIRDVSGRLVGASKVARDITATVNADLALNESQNRLQELKSELLHVSRISDMGEMASALAHELNQPLAAMSNYLAGSRRLLDGSSAPNVAKIRGALDKAAEQAHRAGQIIRRLRDFVRREESERRAESMSNLVEEAVALALVNASVDGASLKIELDKAHDLVLVDRIQVQQVLLNLFRNAIEAMKDVQQKDIAITSYRMPGSMIEIAVSDCGPGVNEDVLSRLFQPFVSTKKAGLGIGLSISRTIVEAHGGRISAKNNDAGGASFFFTLPLASAEEPAHVE